MRLFLALRTSKSRRAKRPAAKVGEPASVSFQDTLSRIAGFGRVVSHDDSPAGLAEEFVQIGNLWAHAASAFTDWEPLEPCDPITALGLAAGA